MKRPLFFLSIFALLFSFPLSAQIDSLQVDREDLRHFPWQEVLSSTLPFAGMSVAVAPQLDRDIHALRGRYVPSVRTSYDDYMQFLPWTMQLSLGMIGLEGRSASRTELLVADALAMATMLTLVHPTKWATHRLRADGSSSNSFPSGHTATAFLGAELLDLEYGARYPWLSALGYTAAYATGVGRILNDRHWASDVWAGAGIGILSAQMGYFLSDMIFGDRRKALFESAPQDCLPHTLSLQYATSHLLQHYYGGHRRQALRQEVALTIPYDSEMNWIFDLGITGGIVLPYVDLPSQDAKREWYVGYRTDVSYFPSSRLALGLSGLFAFYPKPPHDEACTMLGEYGLRGHLDYYVRPHRSIRLFLGASHCSAYYPSNGGSGEDSDYRAEALRSHIEVGVSLLLHL